eukprot:144556-Pyramimonas_sp.AAC.1
MLPLPAAGGEPEPNQELMHLLLQAYETRDTREIFRYLVQHKITSADVQHDGGEICCKLLEIVLKAKLPGLTEQYQKQIQGAFAQTSHVT